MWEGKPPRVTHDTLIGKISRGGLKLCDVGLKLKSFRLKVVKKFLDLDNVSIWKIGMGSYLETCGGLGQETLLVRLTPGLIKHLPSFYREVLLARG